jgi:hypothetical protein
VIDEFQAQSLHRRKMERLVVWSDVGRSYLGLLIGGALAAYMVYTGGVLLLAGQSVIGFGTIGVAIALGVGPFIIRSRLQSQERQAQKAALPGNRGR